MKFRPSSLIFAIALLVGTPAWSQTFLLDDFGDGGNSAGVVVAASSWNGQLTQNPTTLTVGGTALSDSGWEATNLTLPDLSGYNFVALTAQLSGSNLAANIFVTFDDGSSVQTVTFLASSFTTGSMTTVYVPFTWTINPTTIEAWNIGGGVPPPAAGSPAFRMTFDNLALTVSAIPEPSTYAAIAGVLALGVVAIRRRRALA